MRDLPIQAVHNRFTVCDTAALDGNMIRTTRPLTYVALTAACALIFSTSCSLKIRKKAPTGPATAHPTQDLAVSPNQIRLRMRSLVEPFAGEIEQTADTITAGTSDR